MPKPTFFNLPPEKRERFVQTAVEEFARHPYDTASVSAIVERLGIAKGSVYQYFDGKRDLFEWLVLEGGRRQREWMATQAMPEGTPFFERLRQEYRIAMQEWQREPLWNRVRMRAIEPTKDEGLEEFRAEIRKRGHAYVKQMLAAAQDEGAVRTDIDLDTSAWLVMGLLQQGLIEALAARGGIDLAHLPDDPDAAAAIPKEALYEVADVAVDLLARGIGT